MRWVAVLAPFVVMACDPGYRIEGNVVDSAGLPVVAATVKLSFPSGMVESTVTDPAGHFSFGGVGRTSEAGKATLVVDKAGFVSQTLSAPATCFRSTQKGNFAEQCKPGEGKITLLR